MLELSLHILDILENALEAGASLVRLMIEEDLAADRLNITVEDDGRGMDQTTLERVLDPFFTTRQTRHVGLGLPLLKASADRCNGSLEVESPAGRGTRVTATFQHSHIDRAPMGRLADTLVAFLMAESRCDLVYLHRRNGREFSLDTRAVRQQLGGLPLSHPAVREWLRDYIAQGEQQLDRRA